MEKFGKFARCVFRLGTKLVTSFFVARSDVVNQFTVIVTQSNHRVTNAALAGVLRKTRGNWLIRRLVALKQVETQMFKV